MTAARPRRSSRPPGCWASTRSTPAAGRPRSAPSPTAPPRSRRSPWWWGPAAPGCRRRSARSAGTVGIDGIAGPSEVMIIADASADPGGDGARPAGPGRARRRLAGGARERRPRGDRGRGLGARGAAGVDRARHAGRVCQHAPGDRAGRGLRAGAPRGGHRAIPRRSPRASRGPARCSWVRTAPPPSATTSRAPTTSCPRAAPRVTRRPWGQPRSCGGCPWSR